MRNELKLDAQRWLSDPAVRICAPATRAVLVDVLCHLSLDKERGVSRRPLSMIAQAIGATVGDLMQIVELGLLKGHDGDQGPASSGPQDLPLTFRARHARGLGREVTLVERTTGPLWYHAETVISRYKGDTSRAREKVGTSLAGTGSDPARTHKKEAPAAAVSKGTSTELDCPRELLISAFGQVFPNAPKPRSASADSTLGRAIGAMWKRMGKGPETEYTGYRSNEEGLVKWKALFGLAAESAFLRGEVEGRNGGAPFRISLDWLLTPKHLDRVINGFYSRSNSGHGDVVASSTAAVVELMNRRGMKSAAPVQQSMFS